jgi:S-DNA-T family DNA segregation ATPase FtsK/SpoIIIE
MTLFSRAVPERVLHIALPRPPQPNQPHPFPWLATVAPVAGAVGLWAITHSVYALVFAALGPVIAVASVGDSRLSARSTRRNERARFERELRRADNHITSAHVSERRELTRIAPGARALLTASLPDPERWRGSLSEPVLIRLGGGTVPSAVVLDGSADSDDWARPQLDGLRTRAAQLTVAPVLVDARLGIGLCGQRPLVLAAARAIVIQLAAQFSPSAVHIDGLSGSGRSNDHAWEWLALLPHEAALAGEDTFAAVPSRGEEWVRFTAASEGSPRAAPGSVPAQPTILVALAPQPADLSRQARVVVSVGAEISTIIRHPDPDMCGELVLDFVSDREAAAWARNQSLLAHEEGLATHGGLPPDRATLRDVLEMAGRSEAGERSDTGLRCAIGVSGRGVVSVDLVDDGPHAIVGGTTGSGKSELLISWVLSMAASRSPAALSFLFVDFKGGSAFEPLRLLPHSVGVITDLDAHAAHRALDSLSAEVRHRERTLAGAGVRSVDEWGASSPLARLVIVVDEYAAMLDEHPALHALFVDLAARGRSLGIHLILCTQRPGGVVRDSILANCGLRLCLRVNNTPDSIGVVGTAEAALLPAVPRGRAVLRIHGGATTLVQVAHTAPSDIPVVSEPWTDFPRPQPPWRPPLPIVVPLASLPEGIPTLDVPFALVDYPREQRQEVGRFVPAQHGNLLVVGAGGSGKSALLDTFAAASTLLRVDRVHSSVPALWDAAHAVLCGDPAPDVLLVDDLDAIVLGCPEEYSVALLDLLTRLLREGPSRGVVTVITAQRIPGSLSALAALCGSSLLLRTSNRQEHILAGGESADWQPNVPPGSAIWQGHRLQVALAPQGARSKSTAPRALSDPPVTVTPTADVPLAVISTRPHEMAERLRECWPDRSVLHLGSASADPSALFISLAGTPPIVVGGPDAWHSRWGALAALRETAELLFDGCSTSEFRALTGSRDIPPPCDRGSRPLWLVLRTGTVHRGALGLLPQAA